MPTATPNGSPGTGDNRASPAGSCGPGALAALQPSTATLDTTGAADTGRDAGAAFGALLEVHAVSASARVAAAMAHGEPHAPDASPRAFDGAAEYRAAHRHGQEMYGNV